MPVPTKSQLLVLLTFIIFAASAQTKDLSYYQCAFFESYRSGNMGQWRELITEMENAKSADLAWQTEMVKAMYGMVGYEIGAKNMDLAKVYVEKADIYVDKLLEKYPKNARIHSISAALYGYKIALAPYKATLLGQKNLSHIEQAIGLDPAEPMGQIEKGNSLMYRPAIFGGDRKAALTCYLLALKLMEAQNSQPCDWQKMLLRAFILKALYANHQTAEASTFLEKMQKDYGSIDWIKPFVGEDYMGGK